MESLYPKNEEGDASFEASPFEALVEGGDFQPIFGSPTDLEPGGDKLLSLAALRSRPFDRLAFFKGGRIHEPASSVDIREPLVRLWGGVG